MPFLLWVEAVNFASVFEDTGQVSVIRGAGLVMREMPAKLARHMHFKPEQRLFEGSSTGIFRLEGDPAPAIRSTRAFLAKSPYTHFTFVAETEPFGEGCAVRTEREAYERLQIRIRIAQSQSLNLALPPAPRESDQVCERDHWRPGGRWMGFGTERGQEWVSESVAARFRYGRKKRACFHLEHAEREHLDFTDDLAGIATLAPDPYRHLDGKMAVIAVDGNAIGNHRKRALEATADLSALHTFSQKYAVSMKAFHGSWLDWASADPAFQTSGSTTPAPMTGQPSVSTLRMEFLLWGGDEMVLVVPAWRGLETLHFLFHSADPWDLGTGQPASFSAGLVFCHHKAPLAPIRKLAHDLMEGAKEAMKSHAVDSEHPHPSHAWDYRVLESVDVADEPVTSHLERIYGSLLGCPKVQGGRGPLQAWRSNDLASLLKVLEPFPGRELHQLAQSALEGPESFALALWRAAAVGDPDLLLLKKALPLFQSLGRSTMAWPVPTPTPPGHQDLPWEDLLPIAWSTLHLRELRDYLLPWTAPAHAASPTGANP